MMTKKTTKKVTPKKVVTPEPKFFYEDEVVVTKGFYAGMVGEAISNVFINGEYHYLIKLNDFDMFFKESDLELFIDEDCYCAECDMEIKLAIAEALYSILPRYKKLFTNRKSFINNIID